jgi:O-antigen/teichoic acid export membrane protein
VSGNDAPEHELVRTRTPEPTSTGPESLTGAVVGGALWKTGSYFVQEATRVVVVVILARILDPSEYGVASLTLVIAGFLLIFTDPALGGGLIQRATIDEDDCSTVFWLTLGLGLGLTVLGIAIAPALANAFGEPELRELFTVASVCLVLISVTAVPRALLWRSLAYRSIELRDMCATILGGGVAVIVAVAGFGAWAIIANWLVYCLVSAVLVYALTRWRPRFRFSGESARTLGAFGAKISGTMVLNWTTISLDKVLIGRVRGAAALGAYSLAYNVMFLPITRIAFPLASVLFPAYSRLQADAARLEGAWLRSKRLAVAMLMPCFVGMFVVAPDLVPTVFGSQWDEAVVPLQLLALAGVAHAFGTFDIQILEATGRAGRLLRLTLVLSVASWLSFAIGVAWGIVGVAAAYAIVRWLLAFPLLWGTTQGVGFAFRSAFRAATESLPVAVAAGLAALAARTWLYADAANVISLVATTATFVAAYVLLATLVLRPVVADLRQTTLGRLRRPARTSAS